MNTLIPKIIRMMRRPTSDRSIMATGCVLQQNTLRFWREKASVVLICPVPITGDEPVYVSFDELRTAYEAAKTAKAHLAYDKGRLNGVKLHAPDKGGEFPPVWNAQGAERLYTAPVDCDELERLMPAVAENDIRYYLNGVLFDGITGNLVATDGHRMHILPEAIPKRAGAQWIVPRWAIELALEVGATAFSVYEYAAGTSAKTAVTLIGPTCIIAGVEPLDGKFPDYHRAVPSIEQRPQAFKPPENWDAVLDLARKVFKAKKFPGVRVVVNGKTCWFEDPAGEVELMKPTGKASARVCVDVRYLSDVLDCADIDGEVLMRVSNDPEQVKDSALLVTGERFIGVVMPMCE